MTRSTFAEELQLRRGVGNRRSLASVLAGEQKLRRSWSPSPKFTALND